MKVAMAVWEDALSTVCDFCGSLLLFNIVDREVRDRRLVPFVGEIGPSRVHQLEALGIEVLLCGAISRPLERTIRAAGIEVIPYLRGSVNEVIRAYLEGRLQEARFLLPGFHPETNRREGRKRWRGCEGCARSTHRSVAPGGEAGTRGHPPAKG